MRILVTGSEGQIGKYLCRHLKSLGYPIMRCDIIPGYADDYVLCNINNSQELSDAFDKFNPEVVFHLAAIYGRLANERYANIAVDTNINGTNNIIQLCKKHDCKLIHFSTSEVYGDIGGDLKETRQDLSPNNRYGMLKLFTERMIQYEVNEYGLKAIILRPNMIYSEGEVFGEFRSAMIRFVENLLLKQKITVYKDSSRSWLYIGDAVKIFERCIYINPPEIINIAHPVSIPTTEFAKIACDLIGASYRDYVIEEETPHRMTRHKIINTTKMVGLTGVSPKIDIVEGLNKVIESVKQRLWEK